MNFRKSTQLGGSEVQNWDPLHTHTWIFAAAERHSRFLFISSHSTLWSLLAVHLDKCHRSCEADPTSVPLCIFQVCCVGSETPDKRYHFYTVFACYLLSLSNTAWNPLSKSHTKVRLITPTGTLTEVSPDLRLQSNSLYPSDHRKEKKRGEGRRKLICRKTRKSFSFLNTHNSKLNKLLMHRLD